MNASDYKEQERVSLAGVELVQKAKRCGKENCGQCPHKGYWYARIPFNLAKRGRSLEVYLGRAWSDADLRRDIATCLCDDAAEKFVAVLDERITREQIARLVRELQSLSAERVRLENEYKRQLHYAEVREKTARRAMRESETRLKGLGKMLAGRRRSLA